MIKEVCVENFTFIPEAIFRGADRIELCDNLAVGGTTVSHGVAMKSVQYCKRKNIKIMAIIRPRGGDFIYDENEIEIMYEDIIHLRNLGIEGVVIGCLDHNGWIDEKNINHLLEAAGGLDTTFHMAFDQIKEELKFEAIDWFVERKIGRILTHGGPLETPIEENVVRIKEYMEYASDRIVIMPGGGITNQNLDLLTRNLKLKEVHGTKILGSF